MQDEVISKFRRNNDGSFIEQDSKTY